MNKETFVKLLEKAKTDECGNLYVDRREIDKDWDEEQRIYFGTITTVCDDLVEEYCSKTNDGFELYDRHFWNNDTLECQIVNVGKLKNRDDEEK